MTEKQTKALNPHTRRVQNLPTNFPLMESFKEVFIHSQVFLFRFCCLEIQSFLKMSLLLTVVKSRFYLCFSRFDLQSLFSRTNIKLRFCALAVRLTAEGVILLKDACNSAKRWKLRGIVSFSAPQLAVFWTLKE